MPALSSSRLPLAWCSLLFVVACASEATSPPIQPGTRITIEHGTIEGVAESGARKFLGIPYAKPPIGALRWRAPELPEAWGVREAKEFGSACAQLSSINSRASQEEDCLYLNVWTPDPAPTEPLPVMVWLHGGGNRTGAADDAIPLGLGGLFYDGTSLATTRNVVVVTLNYRLGVFGFFSHPALAEATDGVRGNQGLLDQNAALAWVQRNILAFGGDPDNVTLFGEYAGALDTCLHMVAPMSGGLFHRALGQSLGCTGPMKTRAEAELEGTRFAETVGCEASADVIACLRGKPVAELLREPAIDGRPSAPERGGDYYQGGTAAWSFNPIVDGEVVVEQPRRSFDAGEFAPVPFLLGANRDEGTLFHLGAMPVETEEEYRAALARRFGEDVVDAIVAAYPPASFPSVNDALIRVTGDSLIVCPTWDTALRASRHRSDVWLYNFERVPPVPVLESLGLGAVHGLEIAYAFGTYADAAPADRELIRTMQGYWTRFAETRDPNGEGALAWPSFEEEGQRRLNFDVEPSVIEGFRRAECEMWLSIE